MIANFRRSASFLVVALTLTLFSSSPVGQVQAQEPTLYLPLILKSYTPPSGPIVQVRGRVLLQGRDDHRGATLRIDGVPVAETDSTGHFDFTYRLQTMETRTFTVTAHFPAYLWAQTVQTIDQSLVFELPDVCLLGGDVQGSEATTVIPPDGCPSTDPVLVPGPPDGEINLLDTTLIGLHMGINDTDPRWGPDPCNPGTPYLGYRADVNGDGRVDAQDQAIAFGNHGMTAPTPWVACPQ